MGLKKINREMIEKAMDNQRGSAEKSSTEVVKTGYIDLDYVIGGLKKGETYLLAGSCGIGKTAFALNLIENIAVDRNKNVAFFSLDLSTEQIIVRLANLVSKSGCEEYTYHNNLGLYRTEKVDVGISKIESSSIFIDDTPGLNAYDIQGKIRESSKFFDLIIIDNLQLMGSERDENRIFENLERLKQVAHKQFCPILLLSELYQEQEGRTDYRPTLRDLGYPGIEKYVDNILFLYREDSCDNTIDSQQVMEIIVDRQGDTSTVLLEFLPKYQKFATIGSKDGYEARRIEK